MKYATFDENGVLTGRYDSTIHSIIPAGATELANELFFQTINETDGIWKLVNGVVTKTAFPPPVPVIPSQVKMVQARLALLQRGYLTQSQAIIDAMTGDEGIAARIQWEFSEYVERSHPLVQAIKALLPLTEAELDDLFTLADSL